MKTALIIWAAASLFMLAAMVIIAVTHANEQLPDERQEQAKRVCV